MTHIENEAQGSEARSPVIDLEAEDISPAADTGDTEPAKEEAEAVSSPPPEPEKSSFWTKGRIAGAVAILAALLGAWAYREFGAPWWPPSAMSVMEEKLGTLEASNRTLNEQLVALSTSFDTFKSQAEQSRDEQAKAASGTEGRLAGLEKALGELRQSIAGLSAGPAGTADPSALADITRRIEQLEQQVAALREGGPTPATGDEDFAQLSQALSDLKAKFQAGTPYKEELDRIAIYVPGNADFADLEPYAASGIANADALGAALEALIPTLAGPASDEPTAAEASGFWAWVGTVVKVRDLNTLDWGDLAKSAAADAKAGDLKSAIARLEEPGGDLPSALADWRDKARQRLKAEGAMAQLAAALTQIIMGKP
jgi:hypothetical protein